MVAKVRRMDNAHGADSPSSSTGKADSEASMPMSRALAKLAVATDLGTAARPSTSAAACCNTTALSNANGANKHTLSTGAGSFRLLKPSSSRNAARPKLLMAMPHAGRDAPGGRSGSPPPSPAPTAAAAPAIPTASPTTPRLPPLPSASPHATPSPPPQPSPTAPSAHYAPALSTALSQHRSGPLPQRLPLPACGPSAASDISKELRETAKKHPGLPASLLQQLHHPRSGPSPAHRSGHSPARTAAAPTTAASASATTGANAPTAAAASAAGGSMLGSSLSCGAAERTSAPMRPLSPRTRARATASLTSGGKGAAAGMTAAGSAPPMSSLTSLSPEALAVLLVPSQSGPPPTPGGLLVMRRPSGLVGSSSGGGAPLRLSPPSGGGSAGLAGTGAALPSRPAVVPHITVPYKPGSIRLPPGSRCGTAAGSDAGARQGLGTATSLPGPAASGGGEPLRPWTSAGAPSAFRPATANPLTHSMAPDPATAIVVRMPRAASEAGGAWIKGGAGMPPTAAALALLQQQQQPRQPPPQTAASTISLCSTRSICGTVVGGGQGLLDAEGSSSRQLSAEELQALVAALAAARPQAAAMLFSRPGTAAAGRADSGSQPGTGARRPGTGAGGDGTAAAGVAEGRPSSRCGEGGEEGALRRSGGSAAGSRPVSRRGSATAWHDDRWPDSVPGGVPGSAPEGSAPRSAGSARPGSGAGGGSNSSSISGSAPAASNSVPVNEGAAAAIAAGVSRGMAASSGRATAWGTRRRPLQPIPEDAELSDEEAGARPGSDEALMELLPLEPLDPDPDLDAAWESIVNSNQRPDTAALQSPFGSINVFGGPVNIPRQARQAAPMVLVVDNISASTPEVVERELTALSLEQLKLLRDKLIG